MTKKIMTATAASSPAANSSDARQSADSIMPESTRLKAEPPTPLAAMTMPVTTPRWLWNQLPSIRDRAAVLIKYSPTP